MSYKPSPCRLNYEPAKTFDEIADAMGETTSTVQNLYNSAMRKLMDDPRAFDEIRETVAMRDSLRAATAIYPTLCIKPLPLLEMEATF